MHGFVSLLLSLLGNDLNKSICDLRVLSDQVFADFVAVDSEHAHNDRFGNIFVEGISLFAVSNDSGTELS